MRTSESSATLIGVPEGMLMATVTGAASGDGVASFFAGSASWPGGRTFSVWPKLPLFARSSNPATPNDAFKKIRLMAPFSDSSVRDDFCLCKRNAPPRGAAGRVRTNEDCEERSDDQRWLTTMKWANREWL